jgi:hypothetical protein
VYLRVIFGGRKFGCKLKFATLFSAHMSQLQQYSSASSLNQVPEDFLGLPGAQCSSNEIPRSVGSLQEYEEVLMELLDIQLVRDQFEGLLSILNQIVLRVDSEESDTTAGEVDVEKVSDFRFGQDLLVVLTTSEVLTLFPTIFESYKVNVGDKHLFSSNFGELSDYSSASDSNFNEIDEGMTILLNRDVGGLHWKMDMAGNFLVLYNVFSSMVHSLSYRILLSGPYKSLFLLQQFFPIEVRYRRHFLMEDVSLDFVIAFCAHKSMNHFLYQQPKFLPIRSVQDIPQFKPEVVEEKLPEQKTITVEYTFKQREVSCLIGHQGARLNEIRSSTGCTIKVMSVDTESGISFSLPRNLIPQQVSITGYHENVGQASKLIEHYIQLFRCSESKYV